MLTTVTVTLDDSKWPTMSLIVKEGTRVQTASALCDVASTKFAPIIGNFINNVIDKQKQTRKQYGS